MLKKQKNIGYQIIFNKRQLLACDNGTNLRSIIGSMFQTGETFMISLKVVIYEGITRGCAKFQKGEFKKGGIRPLYPL